MLSDDRDQLGAAAFDASTYHSFVLNRHNGLAIWSRTRPFVAGYDGPLSITMYMSCQKQAG